MFNRKNKDRQCTYDQIIKKASKNSKRVKRINNDFDSLFDALTTNTNKILQTRY